jgi:hypothetical protein
MAWKELNLDEKNQLELTKEGHSKKKWRFICDLFNAPLDSVDLVVNYSQVSYNQNLKVNQMSFDIQCSDRVTPGDLEDIGNEINKLINTYNSGEDTRCLNSTFDYEDITEQYKKL